MFMKDKKGAMGLEVLVKGLIIGIIGFVVIFTLISATASTLIGSVTNTGAAFAGNTLGSALFSGNNSIMLIIIIVSFFLGGLALAFGIWKLKSGGK